MKSANEGIIFFFIKYCLKRRYTYKFLPERGCFFFLIQLANQWGQQSHLSVLYIYYIAVLQSNLI